MTSFNPKFYDIPKWGRRRRKIDQSESKYLKSTPASAPIQ